MFVVVVRIYRCTWMAGVEVQTGFCRLQQPLGDPAGQNRRRENHRPFVEDPNHLNQTERDQLLLMPYKHPHDHNSRYSL